MKKFSFLMIPALCLISSTALSQNFDVEELKKKYIRPTEIPFPADNQYTDAKYNLGKTLYFDPRLSKPEVMSCATCHNPSFSWGDSMPKGVGFGHKQLGRKSPSILNLAWDPLFMWDGRAESLEHQALGPIQAAVEMNLPLKDLINKLNNIPGYKPLFEAAFPENPKITPDNIAKSIAVFERKVVSTEAPFDLWIKGDETAISDKAKNGFVLFNTKAGCATCHKSWRFSDGSYHDIGLPSKDNGRGNIEKDIEVFNFAFKTVGLRDIDRRGPYMHDGSIKTLMDVINHYDKGFAKRPSLSGQIKTLNLAQDEKEALVEFMKTLTGKYEAVSLPELPR